MPSARTAWYLIRTRYKSAATAKNAASTHVSDFRILSIHSSAVHSSARPPLVGQDASERDKRYRVVMMPSFPPPREKMWFSSTSLVA